jgi:sigma-E factor negative regulatory protein RseB
MRASVSMSKWLLAGVFIAQAATNLVAAQTHTVASGTVLEAKTVNDWLMRMHEASQRRAYVGTFVVSSSAGMSSAKIWHVCDGTQQMERVETLSGEPRATFRHNDLVRTFLPNSKTVVSEKRESLGIFPNLLSGTDNQIADFYSVKVKGKERVAGVEADVLHFAPKDKLRFGYRIWAEAQRGLVVKMQTLQAEGAVLEQAAFSELQLDAPVKVENLTRMMNATEGYKMQQPDMVKTTAAAEGWALKTPVPGFKPMGCFKRPMSADQRDSAMQWIFSDGLASVSLFVESDDGQRPVPDGVMAMGATHTLVQRLGKGYRVTVMGEAPPETLKLFAQGLERKK